MKYEAHPLASLFPRMMPGELEILRESIKKNGQREPIVLLDGKILEGLSRAQCCQELGIAPVVRNYSPDRDGPSPADFVVDANVNRRHLTASQRATIGVEILPYYEAEANERKKGNLKTGAVTPAAAAADPVGKSTERAAEHVQASPTAIREAKKLKEEAPEKFEEVKSGKKTLNKAVKETKDKPAEPEKDEALDALRMEKSEALAKSHGAEFAQAFVAGTVLPNRTEVEAFLALDEANQKRILNLVVFRWKVAKAIKFVHKTVEKTDPINDLIVRTLSLGKKKHTFKVGRWTITVSKDKEGSDSEESAPAPEQ